MSVPPSYSQFLHGKFKGESDACYQVIASSPRADAGAADAIHQAFADFHPLPSQYPFFRYRLVLRVQPESIVLANCYPSSEKEPGRNLYLLVHYQMLTGSNLWREWRCFELLAASVRHWEPSRYEELVSSFSIVGELTSFPFSANPDDYRIFCSMAARCHSLWKAAPPTPCRFTTPNGYSLRDMLRDVYLILNFAPPEGEPLWFVLTDSQSIERSNAKAAAFVFEPAHPGQRHDDGPPHSLSAPDAFMAVLSEAIASNPASLPSLLAISNDAAALMTWTLETLPIGRIRDLTEVFQLIWRNAAERQDWPLATLLADVVAQHSTTLASVPSNLWLDITRSVLESHRRLLSRFLEQSTRNFDDKNVQINIFHYIGGLNQCPKALFPALIEICWNFPCDSEDAAIAILFEAFRAIDSSTTFKRFAEAARQRTDPTYISLLLRNYDECQLTSELLNWCHDAADINLLHTDTANYINPHVSTCLQALANDLLHSPLSEHALMELGKGSPAEAALFSRIIATALRLRRMSVVAILPKALSPEYRKHIDGNSIASFVAWLSSEPELLLSKRHLDTKLLGPCCLLMIIYDRMQGAVILFVSYINSDHAEVQTLLDTLGSVRQSCTPPVVDQFVFQVVNDCERKGVRGINLACLCRALNVTLPMAYRYMARRLIYKATTRLALSDTLEVLVAGSYNHGASETVASEITSLISDWSYLRGDLPVGSMRSSEHSFFDWPYQKIERMGFAEQSGMDLRSRWIKAFTLTVGRLQKEGQPIINQQNGTEREGSTLHRLLHFFVKGRG